MKNGTVTQWRRMLPATLACALAAVAMPSVAPPGAALAQAVNNGFAGFARNSNEPIDIESDTLEVQDAKKIAIFRGNVKAVQGEMTLRSKALHVSYTGEQGVEGGSTEITEIRADGPVIITTAQDQTATSEWALFDVKSQTVTIGGNVVLTQGENVIKGDRLVIDLRTGRSRFENSGDAQTGQRARVKGLFMPQQSDKKDGEATKPAN